MAWSAAYKRSLSTAIFLYAAVAAAAAGWVVYRAPATLKDWNARVPSAEVQIRTVYETPQITDSGTGFTNDANVPMPGSGQGYIALVMTDIGISDAATARALDDLPPPVALAFSPYADKLGDWIKKAVDSQRDSLILLPMEPRTYPQDDPGPSALLSRASSDENRHRLQRLLDKAAGTVGAMNFMGSGYMSDGGNMAPVFSALHAKGGIFLQDPVAPETDDIAAAAQREGLPYIPADLRIDKVPTEQGVQEQLLSLEKIARERGYAVGIAQPYPLTFNIIKQWSQSLDKRGIKLVPLAAIWKTKAQHDKTDSPEGQKAPG